MNEHSYRRTAVEGASAVTLVIMLYDRLVADMQRAVAAMRRNDVEMRCKELKHALLILQQLDGSLDHERGGKAARNLTTFYAYARAQIMEAQFRKKPELLEKLVAHVLDLRVAWQQANRLHGQDAPALAGFDSAASQNPQRDSGTLSCTV
jgi:flagellar protein FliS